MGRTPITTTLEGRIPADTSPSYLIQEALGKLLLEDGTGALLLESSFALIGRDSIVTNWD